MRNARLDGLRGIAILLVYAQHSLAQAWKAPVKSTLWWLFQAGNSGWIGVDLFFGLSGFLITGILLDHRDSPTLLRTFFARRAYRILPLYALVLASFWGLPLLMNLPQANLSLGSLPGWSYFVLLQNLFGLTRGYGPAWLGPTWSLAMEEQFYLVFPFLVLALSRRWLGAFIVVALISFPLFRWLYPVKFPLAFPWRGDGLMIGALIGLLVRRPAFLVALRRRSGPLTALALVLCPLLLIFGHRPVGPLYGTALAFETGLLILLCALGREAAPLRILENRFLGWMGRLSYAFYLIHVPVMTVMFQVALGRPAGLTGLTDAVALLAAALISLGLAEVSRVYFEEPLIRRGHRHLYVAAPSTTPTPPTAGA